jgi:hypothetical protein
VYSSKSSCAAGDLSLKTSHVPVVSCRTRQGQSYSMDLTPCTQSVETWKLRCAMFLWYGLPFIFNHSVMAFLLCGTRTPLRLAVRNTWLHVALPWRLQGSGNFGTVFTALTSVDVIRYAVRCHDVLCSHVFCQQSWRRPDAAPDSFPCPVLL